MKATEHEPGIWGVYSSTDTIQNDSGDSRWLYWIDAQIRYSDLGSGANQELIRPAIGYKLGNNLQVWLGYARFRTRAPSGAVTHENRYFQQANWTAGQMFGGTVTMRVRLLERNLSAGEDLGLTLRILGKYTRPIGIDGSRTFIASVEPFFDLRDTDWTGDAGIAQSRIFTGVGWRASDKLTVEYGYMNQFLWRDTGEDVSNHLAVVNFKVKF